MKIKQVEERLNVPRTHIRYLEREKVFKPSQVGSNRYRDFSEEDIQNLEMILILMKAGITAKDVIELQSESCTLDDILSKTEMDMREKADEILGGLELIQELRASNQTYDSLPRDHYWNEIQQKEKSGRRFMGHYELEDISDWVELRAGMERVVECPKCHASNRFDLEKYVYDEYCEGGDRDDDMGPERVYLFDTEEEIQCRKCHGKIKVAGYIREYPVGTYDSEEIKVTLEDK